MSTLEEKLKKLAAGAAARGLPCEIHIEPHQRAPYGEVQRVIAAATQAWKIVGVIGGFPPLR
jgi:hypothetical protein